MTIRDVIFEKKDQKLSRQLYTHVYTGVNACPAAPNDVPGENSRGHCRDGLWARRRGGTSVRHKERLLKTANMEKDRKNKK